ncbi:hypothetical protein [Bacteroides reticulotermitis]|uniref:hypothetical protein n=1 Tax=Bacteroides reticulotermitis TaxID=1133319 RepID=UPI003A8936AB
MIFAPHILQLKVVIPAQNDADGNPIPNSASERWDTIADCKCYDKSADKVIAVNGAIYDYKYRVVYDSDDFDLIPAGSYVRCLDDSGNVRGEGVVKDPMKCDHPILNYAQIWLD